MIVGSLVSRLRRTGLRRFVSSRPLGGVEQKRPPATEETIYLHVGPSGDFWQGPSLFAAKHLQPDYVKSIRLKDHLEDQVDLLLELLEEEDSHGEWIRSIYDEGVLPADLLAKWKDRCERERS